MHVPVTALAFLPRGGVEAEEYILVGEDTQLKAYDAESGALCLETRIFREQPVHGLRVSAGSLLAWGSRSVALCPLSSVTSAIESPGGEVPFERGVARDWVYDGVLAPDGASGVLVTAHNEAVEMKWREGEGISFGGVLSPSRPILYAARVRWLPDGRLLVAGGTVFGEILVWTCRVGSGDAECRVLHALTGHEGSIFGVDISDEIELDERKLRLLASCSDDRTVRVWDISDAAGGDGVAGGLLHEARETGFLSRGPGREGEGTKMPLAMAMGHISRIWHVKFAPLPWAAPSVIPVYSFGEDSTAQLWEFDLEGSLRQAVEGGARSAVPAALAHRATFSNHDGKHIWASAMSSQGGEPRVATGGADGKVSLIEDPGALDGHASIISHETLPLLESLSDGGKGKGKGKVRNRHDVIQRYEFIDEDTLLATTKLGKLLVGSFGRETTWREAVVDEGYRDDMKACFVIASLGNRAALIGTTTGMVYLYAEGQLTRLGSVPGKILNLIPVSTGGDTVTLLITMHGNPDIRILTAQLDTRELASDVLLQGVDERFVLITAAQFHGHLFIGSRSGYMEVFALEDGAYTRITQIGPRSDGAISSIRPLPNQTGPPIFFLTTSRDGKYRIYELDARDRSAVTTHLRHESSPPFGPQVEDAWFTADDNSGPPSLILSGFRSKYFIVWNETAREYISAIDCGGAHRTFAHTKPSRPGSLRFAFTKASRVYVHSQAHPASRALKTGAHGREVRAIAGTDALGGGGCFATGSEDTSVRIWKRVEGPGGAPFRCVAVVDAHMTGLQALKWCGGFLLSSGGNEDFFVWRVSALPGGMVAVFCEGVLGDRSPDADLRITDFDVCGGGGRALRVTMGFSNSVFKTYRYLSPEVGGSGDGVFEVVARGVYTGACLTQVRHLDSREAVSDVLTASTDGHIAVWRPADGVFTLVSAASIHQSSIKSLDLRVPSGDETGYVVVTTGDDNALAATSLVPGDDGTLVVSETTIVRSAHAAAINGVVNISGGKVATVSNDQRVKIWGVGGTREGPPAVRLLGDLYSGVADAGAVEYLAQRGELLVGGVGMEVWDVDQDT